MGWKDVTIANLGMKIQSDIYKDECVLYMLLMKSELNAKLTRKVFCSTGNETLETDLYKAITLMVTLISGECCFPL